MNERAEKKRRKILLKFYYAKEKEEKEHKKRSMENFADFSYHSSNEFFLISKKKT